MFNYIYLRRVLIFIAIIAALPACRTAPVLGPDVYVSGRIGGHAHAPAHGPGVFHDYYYYPDVEVYFDVGRGSYFYFTDGIWRASVTLPRPLRLHLGSHISLRLDTPEPYHFHHKHKKHYPRGYFKKKHKKNKGRYDDRGRGKGRGHDRDHNRRRDHD